MLAIGAAVWVGATTCLAIGLEVWSWTFMWRALGGTSQIEPRAEPGWCVSGVVGCRQNLGVCGSYLRHLSRWVIASRAHSKAEWRSGKVRRSS